MIPAWIGSLLISLLIGLIIGALLKHFLKFGIGVFVLIMVLLSLGYVTPQYFQIMTNLISPEITSIWKDAAITTPSGMTSSVLFFVGLFFGVWKL